MSLVRRSIAVLLAAATVGPVLACGPYDLPALARQAMGSDGDAGKYAIIALRAAGPAGLQALINENAALLESGRRAQEADLAGPPDPAWQRLCAVLDAVGRVRDCYASQLYWYTDLGLAKAAAKAARKPILSLRLMGNLDDEYSCANSRYFRTVLYANETVSKLLRERFILHWESVRPVPRVTIDFGDGRVLERTLTGNSIHYVLNPDGQIIDALPGLYGPKAFLDGLAQAEPYACAPVGQRVLWNYHTGRLNAITAAWSADIKAAGGTLEETPQPAVAGTAVATTVAAHPTALRAAPLAMSKSGAEMPILARIGPDSDTLEAATDEQLWRRIAQQHRGDARLDRSSLRFMREKSALLRADTRTNVASASCCSTVAPMAAKFADTLALDTVRNEYLLHTQLHEWLLESGPVRDVAEFNERVYAELFLTPSSDPWLGLLPTEAYTALSNDGVTAAFAGPDHP